MKISTTLFILILMAGMVLSCTDKQTAQKNINTLTVSISDQTENITIADISSRLD